MFPVLRAYKALAWKHRIGTLTAGDFTTDNRRVT